MARNDAVRSVLRYLIGDGAHGKRRAGHFTDLTRVCHTDPDRACALVERTAYDGDTVKAADLFRRAQNTRQLAFTDSDKIEHFTPETAFSYIKINRGRLNRRLGDKFTGKSEDNIVFK